MTIHFKQSLKNIKITDCGLASLQPACSVHRNSQMTASFSNICIISWCANTYVKLFLYAEHSIKEP